MAKYKYNKTKLSKTNEVEKHSQEVGDQSRPQPPKCSLAHLYLILTITIYYYYHILMDIEYILTELKSIYLLRAIISIGGNLLISNFFVAFLSVWHLGHFHPEILSPDIYICMHSFKKKQDRQLKNNSN